MKLSDGLARFADSSTRRQLRHDGRTAQRVSETALCAAARDGVISEQRKVDRRMNMPG